MNIWDADVDNLNETKNNSKYSIAYLDEVIIRPLDFILHKRNEYVKAFKDSKLMPLIWMMISYLKNIKTKI